MKNSHKLTIGLVIYPGMTTIDFAAGGCTIRHSSVAFRFGSSTMPIGKNHLTCFKPTFSCYFLSNIHIFTLKNSSNYGNKF